MSRASSRLSAVFDPNHDAERLAKGVELPGTPKGIDRLVIRPGNRLVHAFDLFVAACVLYSSIAEPMKVAYQATFQEELEVLFDAVFWLDVALQFVCGYMERGYPVLSLRTVACRYARTWFLIDLVAVVPFEAFADGLSAFRLIKTIRLLRLRRLLNHTKLGSGGNFVRVVIILCGWLLITHWAACTFFALGWSLCGDSGGQYEETWVTMYFDGSQGQALPVFDATSCGDGTPHSIGKVHTRAMYWALSTMSSLGYGTGPVAVTDAEYLLAIACQVLGACVAAAIFSNVAKLIDKLDAAGSRYSAALDSMNEFGKFYRLPAQTRAKLHSYCAFLFAVNRGIDTNKVMSSLPPALQTEVLYMMHQHLVRQVPMFADTNDMFIKALVRVLKPQVRVPLCGSAKGGWEGGRVGRAGGIGRGAGRGGGEERGGEGRGDFFYVRGFPLSHRRRAALDCPLSLRLCARVASIWRRCYCGATAHSR